MAAKTPQQKREIHKKHYRKGTNALLQRVRYITNGKKRFFWFDDGAGERVPDTEVETR